jgi:hypothetical protein
MTLLRNLFLLLLLACPFASAEELTIIELRHRLADQVLPTLQPLLAQGGYLAGANSQLFIKTTPENLEEIKSALAVLDRPLHRLLISVSNQGGITRQQQGYDVDSIATTNHSVSINGHAGSSVSRRDEQQTQQVQALDGSPAYLFVGQQATIQHGGLQGGYGQEEQKIGSALTVTARLVGEDQVIVEVDRDASQGATHNIRDVSALHTEVTGKLGEWISLGDTSKSIASSHDRLSGTQQGSSRRDESISLRVERLD